MNIGLQMQSLYSQFGDIDEVTIELHKELLAINIHNRAGEATIFLQGAQLSHYQPHGERSVIWLSPDCDYKIGSPLRGGIPVCWPWFGNLDKNPQAIRQQVPESAVQAHGFVRQLEWQVDFIKSIGAEQTELQMSLTLDATDSWPFACKLTMTFTIAAQLSLTFRVQNIDTRPFVFSSALHSYFAIGDISQTKIEGLDGKSYIDALDDWEVSTQQGDISIEREIDRIYQTAGDDIQITHNDIDSETGEESQRQITIESKNSADAVVWNPWVEKSRRLSQFNHQAYCQMLCVESANVGSNSVELLPGASHSQTLNIVTRVL